MSGVEFMPHQVTQQPSDAGSPPPAEPSVEVLAGIPPRKRQLWLRSLTSRLVVGVVALVVILVGSIGASTYFALRSFLYERLDQQLAPIAQSNENRLTLCLTSPGTSCPVGGSPGGYRAPLTEWIAVLRSNATSAVTVDSTAESLRGMSLSSAQRQSLISDPLSVHSLTTTDGVRLRVSATELDLPTGHFVVVSGLATNEVTKTLGRLIAIELIIGGAAVVLALGATSWGVRRGLRNLYRVTGTAQEVAAELSPEGAGLDRRVPVVEEGTEVGQLAESMNTLLSAVETQFAARLESEKRMRQFLADASHELRTPLTSIRGYAELARMQRKASGGGQTGTGDNLDRIESEGTRMSRLVDDLLLLARGDADGAAHVSEREPVDIADVVDDAVTSCEAAYPGRPIDVEIASLPDVLGDRDQLLRVVRNLIANAAVHTAPGRPILVCGFTDAGGVVVTVADGGPGLPPEQAAHVFERFWRADKARTRARGGTGLGLSIVAAVVRAHGGSVRFDSDVDAGSTVTVWLPAVVD
jgi:two-component system OmpR family sensor kinase